MKTITFAHDLAFAQRMDEEDPLREYREKFYLPKNKEGKNLIYLCGNSLGLQPKKVSEHIEQELEDWKNWGVEGHFRGKNPWVSYHEILTKASAQLVGAKPEEVVIMNSLTVNLHLMMISFYRPTPTRHKIVMEASAFPSDRYAICSQIEMHGYSPEKSLIELQPDIEGAIISSSQISEVIEREGDSIALILLGGVNYYSGQAFDMEKITSWGQARGCSVGFDLAHAAGNLELDLHRWGVDFAVWCTYKYLNAGPGAVAGCFVHEKHAQRKDLPRLAGWWGHDKETRFLMPDEFSPIAGAEGWQLSNAPIFSMASLKASLDIFCEVGMKKLAQKRTLLTNYLEFLLQQNLSKKVSIITPSSPSERGAQLSLRVHSHDKKIHEKLTNQGVICDWREPDVIRIAPVPLYNSFEDVWEFADILKAILGASEC